MESTRTFGVVLLAGLLIYMLYWATPAYGQTTYGVGEWRQSTSYPLPITSQSCVVYSSNIYCIGGVGSNSPTSAVYYAPLSSNGIGAWEHGTNYPNNLNLGLSCVTNSSYVYCVGGAGSSDTYYANLSNGKVSAWAASTNYPENITDVGCMSDLGYIYCTGGINGTNITNSTYYAPLRPNGIGAWVSADNYPLQVSGQSCTGYDGFMYCVGGGTNSTYYLLDNVSANVPGTWVESADYPMTVTGNGCSTYASFTYCVGGVGVYTNSSGGIQTGLTNFTYFSYSSSAGALYWYNATYNYPEQVSDLNCITSSSYIYCIGGDKMTASGSESPTSDAYYAPINTEVPVTTTTTTTTSTSTAYPITIPGYTTIPYSTSQTTSSTTIPATSSTVPPYSGGNTTTAITNTSTVGITVTRSNYTTTPQNVTNQTTGAGRHGNGIILLIIAAALIIVAGLIVWFMVRKTGNRNA